MSFERPMNISTEEERDPDCRDALVDLASHGPAA